MKTKVLGFTLIEILIVVAVLLILLASGVAFLASTTQQKSLDAKAKEVVELISTARNYAASGYFGSAWGIKVLNDNSYCQNSGDCIVLFKGTSFTARDLSYDKVAQINNGVYLDASEVNAFYFKVASGWLATTTASGALTEQKIILKNNIGETRTVSTTPVGLVYYGS